MYGTTPRAWERDAVVAGPIAFIGLGADGSIPARALDQSHGRTEGVRLLAVVGAHTRLTVAVDPTDAGRRCNLAASNVTIA